MCEELISRKAVLDKIKEVCFSEEWVEYRIDNGSNGQRDYIIRYIEELPTIPQVVCDDDCEHCSWTECPLPAQTIPQTAIKHFGAIECPKCGQLIYDDEKEYEWCHDCKEYDKENHCCHRYSSFIRETLQDSIDYVLDDIKDEIKHLHEWAFSREEVLKIIEKHISRKE